MKRKIISLVVTLAIILSSMVIIVPTAAEEAAPTFETWKKEEASASLAGSGTADDPYQIATPQDFIKFIVDVEAQLAASKLKEDAEGYAPLTEVFYVLTEDIDLSAKHWGINANEIHAMVDFDGDGNKITVAILDPKAGAFGLFGTVREAYIHDLDVKGIWKHESANQTNYQGLVASRSYGGKWENINLELDVDVTLTNSASAQLIGGFVAYATWNGVGLDSTFTNITITGSMRLNAYYKGTDKGTALSAGLFTGRITSAIFEDCVLDADFTFDRYHGTSTVNRCGAFAGVTIHDNAAQTATFINCVNKTRLSSTDLANGGRSGTWIGNAGNGYKNNKGERQPATLTFENCIDISTWYQSKGAKAAVVGYAGDGQTAAKGGFNYTETEFTVNGLFSYHMLVGGSAISTNCYAAAGMLNGVPTYYQDLGDTIEVYVGLAEWIGLSENAYPVYATVVYNGEEKSDPDIDEDLNIAIFTFDKADEEGVFASLVYYSNETDEEVATAEITDSDINWYTFKAVEFENGPYVAGQEIEIATAAQLALLSFMSNNGTAFTNTTIKLTADIDLAGYQWVPMWASHSNGFAGKIDGQGFSIKNMTLTADSYVYGAGFIGRTAVGFEIKNVTFENPVIKAGAIASGSSIKAVATVVTAFYGGTIDNVEVVDLDMDVATEGVGYVGGIVGYLGQHYATIKNSKASGEIYGVAISRSMIGGIAARPRYGFIDNCVSDVDIDVTIATGFVESANKVKDGEGNELGTGVKYTAQRFSIGGIVGEMNSYAGEITAITNCYNLGDIKVTLGDTVTVAAVGGIVGAAGTPGFLHISDCQNNGTIVVDDANAVEVAIPELGEFDDIKLYEGVVGGVVGLNKAATVIDNTTTVAYADTIVGLDEDYGVAMVDGLEVLAGARVRIDVTPETGLANSGLRFDAKVNKTLYDYINSDAQGKSTQVTNKASVKVGMMIVPKDMLGEKTAAELYEDESVLKVDMTKDNFYNVDSNGDAYFSAAIVDLYKQNYGREFVAISYMHVVGTYGDGVSEKFTATPVNYVVFGDIDVTNARSAAFVAGKALEDTTASYTAEQIAVLQQYVAK